MKKILYSSVTKFIAILLMLACAFQTVNLVTDCIIKYFESDREVYGFESSFDESRQLAIEVHEPLLAINSAYYLVERDESNYGIEKLVEQVKECLTSVNKEEKVEYIIEIDGVVLKSQENITKEEIISRRFFTVYKFNGEGGVDYTSTTSVGYYWHDLENSSKNNISVYASLNEEYVEKCERLWIEQRNLVYNAFSQSLGLVLVFLSLLIYLVCVCGKRADGETKAMWLDKIPVEIHLGFMALFVGLGLAVAVILFDEFFAVHLPEYLIRRIVPVTSALAIFFVVTSLLSLVRKIKCGIFLSTSIIFIVLKWTFKVMKRVILRLYTVLNKFFKRIGSIAKLTIFALFKKTSLILISLLIVYTFLITFFAVCYIANRFDLFYGVMFVLAVAVAMVFVAVRARDFEMISKGASEIRNGNLSYVIEKPKCEDMRLTASNINEIAKGLDESVSAKMKAERLKTELITNVSHDLKTPLTSIINYTELLSELENLPQEAKDYVAIIAKKSDRLKTLTQDLFDISKVQSGNESINLEKLDVSLLINQSLGEQDKEIEESGITFITDAEKDVFIYADGRKMSRVIANLIGNILKYSMKGTRAFITAKHEREKAVIEFKNISAFPLDFDADEITARFVRGDRSRTKEGSGLGLAIAKSYTEACGGSFDVILDGDMFKVKIVFDKSY